MANQTVSYQCPNCGGPFHFDPTAGKLECDYCGSSFSTAEIEAFYAQKDRQAQTAFEEAPPSPEGEGPCKEQTGAHWDDSSISASWGEDTGQMRTFSCPSCGGEVLCEMTTAATHCPYCGNPSIVPGQFRDGLKPDYIIPFKHKKEEAMAALKRHYRRKLFLPKAFSQKNEVQKLQGIYVPFWLYDADAKAEVCFDATRSTSHREGDYRIIETSHFDVTRKGNVCFERIPTDASKKMPDDLMDSVEPFAYNELVPFSTAYLPGFFADRYDVTVAQNAKRADERCRNTVVELLKNDVKGFESVTPRRKDIDLKRGKVHYALLPVWLLKTTWEGKEFLFAMNGQTGKFVGNLPVSKKRFWVFWAMLTAALSPLLYFPVHAILAFLG